MQFFLLNISLVNKYNPKILNDEKETFNIHELDRYFARKTFINRKERFVQKHMK